MPTETWETFWGGWELFRLPAFAGTLAGAILGCVGVYVVLRRLVFLSAAVSQVAGLGVAVAFYAQLHWGLSATLASPTAGAAVFTLLGIVVVARERRATAVHRDVLLGIVYLVGAAGTLAVGSRIVQELHDIATLLFGSAVAVLPEDFDTLLYMAVPLLVAHVWLWRGFAAASFDRAGAVVRGLPVRLIEVAFFVSLALSISVCTRVLGALPTFAFSVLPPIAAIRLSPNVPVALVLGAILGAVTGFSGYVVAFLWALPVGAAQTLVAALLVGVVLTAGELRRFVGRQRRTSQAGGRAP